MPPHTKKEKSEISRKILPVLLNPILHPQQNRRLPLIQLTQLIKLKQLVGKNLLIALLHRARQIDQQLMFSCRSEGGVEVAVGVKGSLGGDHVGGGEVADAGFEEVVFHGPFHQIVGDAGAGDFFVVGDGFVVVGFEGGEVGDFEEEFVG